RVPRPGPSRAPGCRGRRVMRQYWQPLLDGAARTTARRCVSSVARCLMCGDCGDETSLSSGGPGLAILHAYLGGIGFDTGQAAMARRLLRRAGAAAAARPGVASLFGGLAGLGWSIAHLGSRLGDTALEEDLIKIDDTLLNHVEQSPESDGYDLISG